jgi:molybdenum cofactor biosynthesis protein MoaC
MTTNSGSNAPELSHLDDRGQARMVDVSGKDDTVRTARARARVELPPEVRKALFEGTLPKGEGIGVARLAGIQAAKETSRLIPLCHHLALTAVSVEIEPSDEGGVEIRAEVRCAGPTGVEMEALTAVSVSALALYDMCKGLSRGIRITSIELMHKSGGKSGEWNRESTT